MKQLMRFFPLFLGSNYPKDRLKDDFTAGLTVGIMLIPQGMAYAMIAGLPPVYGLYAHCFRKLFMPLWALLANWPLARSLWIPFWLPLA